MSDVNKHDASGQLSGYLYQVLSALLLLLEHQDPETQICIEKFDDVAFVEDDTPQIMIQTKHQLYKQGSLNNTSVDLWRTIKSWCDYIKSNHVDSEKTDYIIVTTAQSKDESAAAHLRKSSRDWELALEVLRNTAATSKVESNQSYYKAFLSLNEDEQEVLVRHIYICDNAPTIGNLEKNIMPYIRLVTLPQFEQRVYEKTIGWWIVNVIQCLRSTSPVFISYRQLQKAMYDIGSEYKADSLPIDVDPFYEPSEEELEQLPPANRVFIEQLNLLAISHDRLKRCIRDYYNAYRQRSQWVREQLLFINDLTKYEAKLIDEWNRLFLIMKETLEDYGTSVTENQKRSEGKKLFGKIEELNCPIRRNVSDPFIMRGTYHELANKLRVGWHIDFMKRLCQLLKE